MFEFVKTSNLALDELAKKDKKYKSILAQLKTLLSDIKGEFLAFDKAHKKIEQSTNDQHTQIKERFNEKIKMLNLNLNSFSKDIEKQVLELDSVFNVETKNITQETLDQVSKINILITEIKQAFSDSKDKAATLKSKEISDINKVITEIKKQSAQSIDQLEASYQVEIEKLLAKYDLDEAKLLKDIAEAAQKYDVDKNKMNDVKNFYREQSDKKYLSIKNDYHLASADFNKALEKLKKEKDLNLKKINTSDEKNRLPIEESLSQLKIAYDQQKLEVEQTYKNRLNEHKSLIDNITQDFNTKKDALIVAHGDAISLINSKLSSFRDVVANERIERNTELKETIKLTELEEDIKTLKKSFNRYLRQQENELNRQIIRTQKETIALLKAHYLKLQELETNYLEEKSNWRIYGKKLVIDQKLENFTNEQNYLYQSKSLQLQLKTLKITNDFELERSDTNHLSKIAPLDLKLSIANAVSEKDVNLLSNDTNYHLNHYQHQEDTLTHNFTVYQLTKEHELDVLKLTKEHDLSVLNMSLQLSIDKENVIREQQLSNQQLKKDFSDYTYQKVVATDELAYLKQKAIYETDIVHLDKLERSHHHYFTDKRVVEQNLMKHKGTLEETNIHYLERSVSIDMTNEMMTKDIEVIHSRIHFLFNQIYLIYNIHHHFMLSLIQIYEIPAHPEDVKQFIHLYLETFMHLNTLQESAKDQFLMDLNAFQELKINDLTALKLKTDLNLLESEYLAKIKVFDDEITSLNQLTNQIEDRILVLSSHVDRVQFDLNNLDDETDLKLKSTNKKELEKQLNAIETEISIMDKTIIKYNTQIQLLTQRKDKVNIELDKKRSKTTIKNQADAKSYLKQRGFYIQSIKQITQLFKVYEDKVLMITKKLDQPLYLTDNIIKEYQKGYSRIEDYFEKTSNQHYQMLLKGSVKLFDQLIHQQNTSKHDFLVEQKQLLKKLDKQQIGFEDKIKRMATEFKHHLQLLHEEKNTMIQNIHTVQFKNHEQDILNKQKQMQATENKIMLTESNLKKEMLLIDDNLHSVIDQMHSDFQKQIQKIAFTHDKTIQKHHDQLDHKAKDLKTLEESTKLKNNQLSIRFTQTEVRLIETNKEKLNNFEQTIHRKHAALLKKVQSFADDLKNAQIKKDLLISKNARRLTKFSSKIELHEKKLLMKDLKDARQSYTFKQRTLKL